MEQIDTLPPLKGSLRITHIDASRYSGDLTKPLHPVQLKALCQCGVAHQSEVRDNLVVDVGLSAVSRLLGHGENFPDVGGFPVSSIADLKVSSMRLGNSSSPSTPVAGDTDISVSPATFTISFLTATYPTTTAVTLSGIIPQAQSSLDGVGITEEGLFLANGALVARVTFPAEVKIPSHALQFDHTIDVQRP